MLEEAMDKLDKGLQAGGFDKYGNIMAKSVHKALCDFCRQDGEFAQAVAQGGSFKDCMAAVAKNCGTGISDLEAYRRAVQFYFPGADIAFHMTINLCASVKSDHFAEASDMVNDGKRSGLILDLADFF
jgi:hypothetical protein